MQWHGSYHVMCSKLEKKNSIYYHLYVESKTNGYKWTYRNRFIDLENKFIVTRQEGWQGRDRLGVWDWHVHTSIFKIKCLSMKRKEKKQCGGLHTLTPSVLWTILSLAYHYCPCFIGSGSIDVWGSQGSKCQDYTNSKWPGWGLNLHLLSPEFLVLAIVLLFFLWGTGQVIHTFLLSVFAQDFFFLKVLLRVFACQG